MALQGNFATEIGDLVTDLVAADIVNINEAIWQETFGVGSFTQAHTLLTGRRNGQVQPIVLEGDYYGSMPVGDEKSCALNECDLTPNYSAKEWCLAEYNCRIPICMRSFDEEFLVFWNMYRQALEDPTTEPDAQAFLDYIESIVRNQLQGTQWRVGYWGDTAETENDLINGCDGFFVQAEAGSGEKIDLVVAGATPTGEEIYNAMQEAYEFMEQQVWGSEPNVVWKMSYAAASKITSWLNRMKDTSDYNCECYSADGITKARTFRVETLQVFGIPVEAHREIDLSSVPAGKTEIDKYQILLARKSNLLVGTNSENKLEGFDIFYDKTDRKIYIDTMVRLGVMIPKDEYVYITESGT